MNVQENVIILNSARKHGVSDSDILHVLKHHDDFYILDEDERKIIYVGYGLSLTDLEVITVEKYDDKILVIHAMKLRKTTADWIKGRKDE